MLCVWFGLIFFLSFSDISQKVMVGVNPCTMWREFSALICSVNIVLVMVVNKACKIITNEWSYP